MRLLRLPPQAPVGLPDVLFARLRVELMLPAVYWRQTVELLGPPERLFQASDTLLQLELHTIKHSANRATCATASASTRERHVKMSSNATTTLCGERSL